MSLERHDLLDEAKVPFGKPETRYKTPNRANVVVIEQVPISPEFYEPLPVKSPHPDYANNGLILTWQGPVRAANNQIKVLRVYSLPYVNEDWYNYAIKYSADVYTSPIFIRTYIVPREGYSPPANASLLDGVVGTQITNPGSYTPGSPPTVSFTGGGGSGAAATAIMDDTGIGVIGLDLTSEGSGYVSAPTVVFSGSGGAAATAFIQSQTAYLVKEETGKLDVEDPQLHGLFIKVTRIYETLPGPYVPFTRYDERLGFIAGTRRAVLNSNQSEVLTALMRISYQGRDGSAIVSTETEEQWTDGISTPFPTLVTEEYREPFHQAGKRGATDHREEIVIATGSEVSSLTHTTGVVTKIQYQPYPQNPFLLIKVTETWVDPVVNDKRVTSEFGGAILAVTERTDDVGVQDVDTGYLVVASQTRTETPHEQVKISEILDPESAQARLELTNGGSGYTTAPAVSFTGGTGSGAVASAILGFGIASVTVTNGGSGYASSPAVGFMGGDGGGAFAVAILGFGIDSIVVTDGGSGYSTAPTVTITDDGSGATAMAVLGFELARIGIILSELIEDATSSYIIEGTGGPRLSEGPLGGRGYTTPPAVSIGGDGTGALAHAEISGGSVTEIVIDNPGRGYTSAPTITVSGGDGTGGAGTATLEATGSVKSVAVTAPGSGYTEAIVGFSGGGGTGAAARVNLSTTGSVTSVTVGAPGLFETVPTVTFEGDGTGAAATAVLASTGSVIEWI